MAAWIRAYMVRLSGRPLGEGRCYRPRSRRTGGSGVAGMTQRVAIVTGANRGIGRAIAAGLARDGLLVVATGRDAYALAETAAELGRSGKVYWHPLDITNPASVARCFADVAKAYGRIDVLVNNAGIAIDRGQAAASPDFERVKATIDANLLGAWRCAAAAIPEMRRHGYGRIINMTSHLGRMSTMADKNVSYRVSKAALNALTRVLAAELAGSGILVNAVSPGQVHTRMAYGETTQTLEEGADTAVWLAQLSADGPNGQLFYDRESTSW